MQLVNRKAEQNPTQKPRLEIDSSVFFVILKSIAGLFLAALLAYHLLFWNRIYPGIKIAGIETGGKTTQEAQNLLSGISPSPIVLIRDKDQFVIQPNDLLIEYLKEESVQKAYNFGRRGDPLSTTKDKLEVFINGANLPLAFKVEEDLLDEIVAEVAEQFTTEPIEPSVSIQNNSVIVNPGKNGEVVNKETLKNLILDSIAFVKTDPIPLPLEKISPKLTDEEAEKLRVRAQSLLGKKLQIKVEEEFLSYSSPELAALLEPEGVNREKIISLAGSIAKGVERPPQNARFVFENGKVKEFAPGKSGIEVQKEELVQELENGLKNLLETDQKVATISLPVKSTTPEVLTGEVNDLGIKELIGKGTSLFRGSIPSRVHNVALAASRINGTLIKPGETFSFNQALGDVSVYTGYQQAYVIRDGRTVLGDGGGVCQVSTTFFRAALNSGIPILERRAHSYRVGYYEQDSKPGLDATVYSPSVDLKIKNDTPGHILIQTKVDTKSMRLTIELYGTPDGRVATVSTPRVWDIKPAPPPLYQDDPTLPAGAVKQVDFAAPGARAAFDYKVTRNGEVLQDRTFSSNYRPWQAIYLRGTGGQ